MQLDDARFWGLADPTGLSDGGGLPLLVAAASEGLVEDLDRKIAALAARNHSLFKLADVIAAGGSRAHAHTRVRTGRWESPWCGVYRIAGIPWTYEARVLAAVLATSPGAVASHLCAVLDGVTDSDSELVAWTLLRERGLPEPVLHHQVRSVEGELLAEIDLAWVERKAAIEIDGTVHQDPVVRAKDEERDHLLRSLGWTVRRVWYLIPLEHPDRFVQLARHLWTETNPA